MDPVLFTFHAPHHELDLVSRYVLRDRLADHLLLWRRITGACELLYLATCQRAMWILWGGDGEALGLAPEVTRFEGAAAWRHLLEVSTGLVSANLGDREIVDQMKDALENAKEAGAAGVEAQAALEDVLREAQRLRVRSGLADGSASVATAALKHLEEALPKGASIAVVGMGPMSQYLAQRLPERGFQVTLSNRTAAKAELMGYPTVPLEQLQHDPVGFNAIVTATASPRPLFTLAPWERLKRPPLRLLDLALPHDSEPALGQLPWVHRVDLAGFLAETEQAKAKRFDTAQKVEPFVLGAVGRLQKRAQERDRKYNTRTAHDRMADAWGALEDEALNGIFRDLDETKREALKALLKRGRTLSYRELSQFHRSGHP
jgi:glutamyl-tRNA reductase